MGALGQLPQQAALGYLPTQEQLNALGQQGQAYQQSMGAAQQALGAGTVEQQQQQAGYDTSFQNAMRQQQYPYTLLDQLGGGLQSALGPGGNQSASGPIRTGAWGGLK
jgi:hypothetical protein